MSKKLKISKLKLFQYVSLVLGIALVVSLGVMTTGSNCGITGAATSYSAEEILNFVNDNLLPNGTNAELVGSRIVDGVKEIDLTINGQQVQIYNSGDFLFLSAIKMSEFKNPQQQQQPQQVTEVSNKTSTPTIKLFVMSHCPFGTQMEKGIIPVINLLKDKVNFNVEFVYYSMHGKTEINEEMRQTCIQKEYPEKYLNYLTCFLSSEDGSESYAKQCMVNNSIDENTINTCMTDLDNTYGIMEKYNDKSTWLSGRYPVFPVFNADNEKYGVKGSPTLVINEQVITSARDSASLLSVICSAFDNPPAECNTNMENTTPSPGFGWEGSGSTTTATCG